MDIIIGLIIVAILALGVYAVTHHKPPTTPAGADLANVVSSAAADSWEALKRDLPAIVSADIALLQTNLADMEARALAAEAKWAAEVEASGGRLEAVKAEVAAVIARIGAQPASAVPVAAVAAAQAQDAADVRALATEFTPASQTLS